MGDGFVQADTSSSSNRSGDADDNKCRYAVVECGWVVTGDQYEMHCTIQLAGWISDCI